MEGPKEKLDSTAISQPAIYVASLAAVEKLRQDEGQVWAHARGCDVPLGAPHTHVRVRPVWAFSEVSTTQGRGLCAQAAVDAIDVAAGLSLGEYTALAFAGAFRWEA